ncbi:MAG: hypothetical protein PHX78_06965 [bacterium]|nr:hypothetical protein [bacterium]
MNFNTINKKYLKDGKKEVMINKLSLSQDNGFKLKIKDESPRKVFKIRQKNIQLRIDQIRKLREFAFHSGNIDGVQLNDSEMCRTALDLFFWLDIDPKSVRNEEELLELCKKKIEKKYVPNS